MCSGYVKLGVDRLEMHVASGHNRELKTLRCYLFENLGGFCPIFMLHSVLLMMTIPMGRERVCKVNLLATRLNKSCRSLGSGTTYDVQMYDCAGPRYGLASARCIIELSFSVSPM